MNIGIPSGWKEVEKLGFEEFLKCVNYTTDNFCDGRTFAFQHNNKKFAVIHDDGKVFVDPSVLVHQ